MRTLLIIGIGAGDPEQLTVQAIRALNRADVIFVIDKREATHDLVRLRREICERYIEGHPYRVVEIDDPQREGGGDRAPLDGPAYRAAVEAWHAARAAVWEAAIRDAVGQDGCGAFLVWGDPSLYDSTIGVVERVRAAGRLPLTVEVIPGITSVQALAAAHGVPLNAVGGAVQITTGRRLAEAGFPREADDVVVLLDGATAFRSVLAEDLDIYWGAYVGTPDEVLIAGPLREVADEIVRARAEARARKGWIMDAYLLRRRDGEG